MNGATTMRKALLFVVMTFLAGAAQAQWKVAGNAASVENKAGHTLTVHRGANGWVWATLALPERSADTLAPGKAPAFRVDAHPEHDSAGVMGLQAIGLKTYAGEPRRVGFVIWQAMDDGVRNDKITQLMTGKDVVFRYTLASGAVKETSFPLNGAGQAIARALDIDKKPDRALVEDDQTFRWAFREVMKKCQREGADAGDCSQRAIACGSKPGSHNLSAFRACVK